MKKGWIFVVVGLVVLAILLVVFRDRIFSKAKTAEPEEGEPAADPVVSEFPLKRGSRGEKVELLQKYLNNVLQLAPMANLPLVVDGIFGDKTALACSVAFGEPVCSEANYNAFVVQKTKAVV